MISVLQKVEKRYHLCSLSNVCRSPQLVTHSKKALFKHVQRSLQQLRLTDGKVFFAFETECSVPSRPGSKTTHAIKKEMLNQEEKTKSISTILFDLSEGDELLKQSESKAFAAIKLLTRQQTHATHQTRCQVDHLYLPTSPFEPELEQAHPQEQEAPLRMQQLSSTEEVC